MGSSPVDCVVIDDKVGNDNYYQENFGCEFELLEPVQMTEIYIKTLPVKTAYQIDEELDLSGLTVIGKYADETEQKLTDFAVGTFDSSDAGEKEVVITYDVFKTSFVVSVIEPVKSDDTEDNIEDDIKRPDTVIPEEPKKEESTSNSSNSTSTTTSNSSGKSHSSGGGGSSSSGARSVATVQNGSNTYPVLNISNPYVYGGQWQQVDGKWKFLANGSETKSSWICLDGKWYLIGEDAYMVTGWAQVNGVWYYFGADGVMVTNEVFIGEKRYKFAENGAWIQN